MTITIPRPEHPNPQKMRENWRNLNGTWNFAFDFGRSGRDRNWHKVTNDTKNTVLNTNENIFENWQSAPNENPFTQQITVPFCPESSLSGIDYQDFIPACWYQREIILTKEEVTKCCHLHFGAVDYFCEVFVNGHSVGTHQGGYASFYFDISKVMHAGKNTIVVYAEDNMKENRQPVGKQSRFFYSRGCDYTRTTGIWQTVWLEFLPPKHIKTLRYFPNIAEGKIAIEVITNGSGKLNATAFYQGEKMGEATSVLTGNQTMLEISLAKTHLWELGAGRLYDITFTFEEDILQSYFGLREVAMSGYRFLLNGRSVFQRTVLDQGFYPAGIYTAPSDEDLKKDIELSLACGFNGARLHEKAFESRFLYHCDRAGYLVWGEMANWGLDLSESEAVFHFLPEWQELLQRDFNHPAIVTWCPMNETWDVNGRKQRDEIVELIYHTTKQFDPTRPIVDTSGNYHVVTDIYDLHDYCQDPAVFKEHFTGSLQENGEFWDEHHLRQSYQEGLPYCVSEYGGIKWDPDNKPENAWGYGDAPQTEEEFFARYRGLTDVLLQHEKIFGFCYTQLYDVEQERNGLYYYDRKPKFDVQKFKEINSQHARIED